MHRKLILGVAGIGVCVGTYYFIYGGSTTPSQIVQQPAPVGSSTDFPSKVRAMWDDQANEHVLNRSWLGWFKTNFYTILQQTTVLFIFTAMNNAMGPISKYLNALDGFVDTSISAVFHEGNLAWFLKRHTQLSVLFVTLEYHAALVEGKPFAPQTTEFLPITTVLPAPEQTVIELTAEKKQYHAEQIIHTWNIMIQQLEYVLGFMQATAVERKWYELAVFQAQALMRTISEEFNNSALKLEHILHGKDTANMYDAIRLLHAATEQDFNAFANLERLKPY